LALFGLLMKENHYFNLVWEVVWHYLVFSWRKIITSIWYSHMVDIDCNVHSIRFWSTWHDMPWFNCMHVYIGNIASKKWGIICHRMDGKEKRIWYLDWI
jgi:hypothetical protein